MIDIKASLHFFKSLRSQRFHRWPASLFVPLKTIKNLNFTLRNKRKAGVRISPPFSLSITFRITYKKKRKMASKNRNKVTTLQQLQQRSEELKDAGYIAVRPDAFTPLKNGGGKVFSWNDYVHSMLLTTAGMSASGGDASGSAARQQVSTIFASSGGENLGKPKGVGTEGLGFMEWGIANRLPNLIWMLSRMSPFTAAGVDYIKKILVGRGPAPKYHYTQYVGGNITEKYIPYESAGVLLRGQIADLKAKEEAAAEAKRQNEQQSQNGQSQQEESPFSAVQLQVLSSDEEDSEEMKSLKEALHKWEETQAQLRDFIENNDLMQTFLDLAGDMALMSQCFVELQLNQRSLDENGKAVPTAQWTPKVIGLKHRSIFTTRLERMDENYRINYAYVSNQWLDPTQYVGVQKEEDRKIAAIPYLPTTSAVKDLQRKIREARQKNVSRKKRPTRFIMSPRDFGGPYYADALWHSIFAGSIFEYAFTIVDDRLTRKRNSNIIGRVIYIHQDYISRLYQQQGEKKKKTQGEIQNEIFTSINTWLSNPDNAGQALISSAFTGSDGKEHKAWEIVEIETKANDQANADKTELQEISSIIFFAMGLDAKLIGNTPGDTASSGGTDLRERFLVKQIQFAPLQQLMIRPLEVLSRFNDWDEHLVWWIDREVLTTLDNSKTGVAKQEAS